MLNPTTVWFESSTLNLSPTAHACYQVNLRATRRSPTAHRLFSLGGNSTVGPLPSPHLLPPAARPGGLKLACTVNDSMKLRRWLIRVHNLHSSLSGGRFCHGWDEDLPPRNSARIWQPILLYKLCMRSGFLQEEGAASTFRVHTVA